MFYEWLNVVEDQWTYVASIGLCKPNETRNASVVKNGDRLFIIIPGNPGVCNFYEDFSISLQSLVADCSVWVVSHLNHVKRPPELKPTAEIPLLRQQIKHKLDFITKYVPKDVKLVLLGHSIGSYMILHILNDLLRENYNVEQCFLLFPTIERMADTPNGKRFVKATAWGLHYVPSLLSHVTFFLPYSVKEFLLRKRLNENLSPCILDGAKQLFHWSVLSNMVWMAVDEMKAVKKLDVDILQTFHDKLTIVYGMSDDWCPLSYANNVQTLLEGKQTKIVFCDPIVEHAFVINSSVTIAEMLATMICS